MGGDAPEADVPEIVELEGLVAGQDEYALDDDGRPIPGSFTPSAWPGC